MKKILCIGQSDSSAGAGVQGDIKTIQALGGYATTVISSVCAQNTKDILDLYVLPTRLVEAQIEAIMDDLTPDVIKIGLLADVMTLDVVGLFLGKMAEKNIPIVIDPVMVNKREDMLLSKIARDSLKRSLIIYSSVLTPNVFEAQELTGMEINSKDDMVHAAEMLITLGPKAVVLTGGGMEDDLETVIDVIIDDKGTKIVTHKRVKDVVAYGAGTVLAAGMALGLAEGDSCRDAYTRAHSHLSRAMTDGDFIESSSSSSLQKAVLYA